MSGRQRRAPLQVGWARIRVEIRRERRPGRPESRSHRDRESRTRMRAEKQGRSLRKVRIHNALHLQIIKQDNLQKCPDCARIIFPLNIECTLETTLKFMVYLLTFYSSYWMLSKTETRRQAYAHRHILVNHVSSNWFLLAFILGTK